MKPAKRRKIVYTVFAVAFTMFMTLPDTLEGVPFLASLAIIAVSFAAMMGIVHLVNKQEEGE